MDPSDAEIFGAKSLSPAPTLWVLLVNALLFSAMGVFALTATRRDLQRLSSVPRFIALSALLRVAWFASEYAGWGTSTGCRDPKAVVSFFGRLAQYMLFAAFSSVLFFWWDVLRAGSSPADDLLASIAVSSAAAPNGISLNTPYLLLCQPKTMDILIKFWVFVILFALFLYKYFSCDDDVRQRVADAEIIALALFVLFLMVGYAIIGYGLVKKLSWRESPSAKQLKFRTGVISACCVFFFAFKSILLFLYPVFQVKLKGTTRDIMYPWFFYTVPEIIPSVTLLVFMIKRRTSSIALDDALLVAPSSDTPLNPSSSTSSGAHGVWHI